MRLDKYIAPSDAAAIVAVGVLTFSINTLLLQFGVPAPEWLASMLTSAFAVIILGLRSYIAIVGPQNTTVDEKLEQIEAVLTSLVKETDAPPTLPTGQAEVHSDPARAPND